jgi:hypothetical protein
MAKDVQEIKVVKAGDGLKVSVKADLATALAMVAAIVMSISEESEIDTKAIYNILSGATDKVKKVESEDFSIVVLTELVEPIIMWMRNSLPPFATIIIDSEGVTVLNATAKITNNSEEGKEMKWRAKKLMA